MHQHLAIGSRGSDVLEIQQALNMRRTAQDATLVEDGIFGPQTDAALRRFQLRNRLPATGIAGPSTRAALFPVLPRPARVWTGGLSGVSR